MTFDEELDGLGLETTDELLLGVGLETTGVLEGVTGLPGVLLELALYGGGVAFDEELAGGVLLLEGVALETAEELLLGVGLDTTGVLDGVTGLPGVLLELGDWYGGGVGLDELAGVELLGVTGLPGVLELDCWYGGGVALDELAGVEALLEGVALDTGDEDFGVGVETTGELDGLTGLPGVLELGDWYGGGVGLEELAGVELLGVTGLPGVELELGD